jgi:hypothetical protein
VPALYQFREYAVNGGLMSYGVSFPEAYREVGIYAARVLNGAKPCGPPGNAIGQIRAGDQPQNRQGAPPNRAGQATCPCRRSDRMKCFLLRCMSPFLGTELPCRRRRPMSEADAVDGSSTGT